MRGWAVAAVVGVLGFGLACGDSQQSPESTQPGEPSAPAPSEPNPQPSPGPSCTPTTCEVQHQTCGELPDGCGGTLTCGEPCTSPEPGPSACEGLFPDKVSPKSRDIITGFHDSCELHPTLDGAGDLAYAAGYVGYGTYRWYVQSPSGSPRNTFVSGPTPELWPQANGFQMVGLVCGGGSSGIGYEAYDGMGQSLATVGFGNYSGCDGAELSDAPDPAGGTVVAWMPTASGEMNDLHRELKVQRFDGTAHARFAAVSVASWLQGSTEQLAVVVGTDVLGRTLVLWNGDAFFGAGSTAGRWLDANGAPLTPVFHAQVPSLGAAADSKVLTPLIGGGLVLQLNGTWTHGFASGSAEAGAPPSWMAHRTGRLEIVRGGKAYALLPPMPSAPVCSQQVEVLAPDGSSCGKLTFDTPAGACVTAPLVLGADGSILQQQALAHPSENGMNGCTEKWWPHILR